MQRSKNKSKIWAEDDGGLQHFGKVYKSLIFCFFGLLGFSFVVGSSEMGDTYAESASVTASAKVLESCSVESTGSDHTATIVAGNYDQIGSDTIFNINCNDPNGYIIYAVGNSNDTEGNTDLIASNNGESVNNNIITGLNTSGDTSNWSFKLSNPTTNLTILSDFNNNSVIPTTRTAVVKREAGTTSPTVDSFHASYSAYVSKTQPVDTYEGKVKYILFHPSTTVVAYYTITYNTNGGSPDIESQSGNTTNLSVKLSDTKLSKDGYEFQGWCTVEPTNNNSYNPTCSGQTYQQGQDYPLNNPGDNDINLYAIWKSDNTMQNWSGCSNLSQHQVVTLTDIRDNKQYRVSKLKDGKCWMVDNLKIGSNSSTTLLKASETNATSDFTLPVGSTNGFPDQYIYNTSNIYIEPNYGGLYTWFAATAGTGTSSLSNGVNATSSICPKGWRLPTGGPNSEFYSLYNQYQNVTALMAKPAPGFVLSGRVARNAVDSVNSSASYWSSTSAGIISSYHWDYTLVIFTNAFSDPATRYDYVCFGRAIRCVSNS